MSIYWFNSNPRDSLFDHRYIKIDISIVKNRSWSVLVFGSASLLWTQYKQTRHPPIFIVSNLSNFIISSKVYSDQNRNKQKLRIIICTLEGSFITWGKFCYSVLILGKPPNYVLINLFGEKKWNYRSVNSPLF